MLYNTAPRGVGLRDPASVAELGVACCREIARDTQLLTYSLATESLAYFQAPSSKSDAPSWMTKQGRARATSRGDDDNSDDDWGDDAPKPKPSTVGMLGSNQWPRAHSLTCALPLSHAHTTLLLCMLAHNIPAVTFPPLDTQAFRPHPKLWRPSQP